VSARSDPNRRAKLLRARTSGRVVLGRLRVRVSQSKIDAAARRSSRIASRSNGLKQFEAELGDDTRNSLTSWVTSEAVQPSLRLARNPLSLY